LKLKRAHRFGQLALGMLASSLNSSSIAPRRAGMMGVLSLRKAAPIISST
jgi:hypothetical protein